MPMRRARLLAAFKSGAAWGIRSCAVPSVRRLHSHEACPPVAALANGTGGRKQCPTAAYSCSLELSLLTTCQPRKQGPWRLPIGP